MSKYFQKMGVNYNTSLKIFCSRERSNIKKYKKRKIVEGVSVIMSVMLIFLRSYSCSGHYFLNYEL